MYSLKLSRFLRPHSILCAGNQICRAPNAMKTWKIENSYIESIPKNFLNSEKNRVQKNWKQIFKKIWTFFSV